MINLNMLTKKEEFHAAIYDNFFNYVQVIQKVRYR